MVKVPAPAISGNAMGTYLAACGFNLDLAPLSDIADKDAKEKKIFYGSDAATVGPRLAPGSAPRSAAGAKPAGPGAAGARGAVDRLTG